MKLRHVSMTEGHWAVLRAPYNINKGPYSSTSFFTDRCEKEDKKRFMKNMKLSDSIDRLIYNILKENREENLLVEEEEEKEEPKFDSKDIINFSYKDLIKNLKKLNLDPYIDIKGESVKEIYRKMGEVKDIKLSKEDNEAIGAEIGGMFGANTKKLLKHPHVKRSDIVAFYQEGKKEGLKKREDLYKYVARRINETIADIGIKIGEIENKEMAKKIIGKKGQDKEIGDGIIEISRNLSKLLEKDDKISIDKSKEDIEKPPESTANVQKTEKQKEGQKIRNEIDFLISQATDSTIFTDDEDLVKIKEKLREIYSKNKDVLGDKRIKEIENILIESISHSSFEDFPPTDCQIDKLNSYLVEDIETGGLERKTTEEINELIKGWFGGFLNEKGNIIKGKTIEINSNSLTQREKECLKIIAPDYIEKISTTSRGGQKAETTPYNKITNISIEDLEEASQECDSLKRFIPILSNFKDKYGDLILYIILNYLRKHNLKTNKYMPSGKSSKQISPVNFMMSPRRKPTKYTPIEKISKGLDIIYRTNEIESKLGKELNKENLVSLRNDYDEINDMGINFKSIFGIDFYEMLYSSGIMKEDIFVSEEFDYSLLDDRFLIEEKISKISQTNVTGKDGSSIKVKIIGLEDLTSEEFPETEKYSEEEFKEAIKIAYKNMAKDNVQEIYDEYINILGELQDWPNILMISMKREDDSIGYIILPDSEEVRENIKSGNTDKLREYENKFGKIYSSNPEDEGSRFEAVERYLRLSGKKDTLTEGILILEDFNIEKDLTKKIGEEIQNINYNFGEKKEIRESDLIELNNQFNALLKKEEYISIIEDINRKIEKIKKSINEAEAFQRDPKINLSSENTERLLKDLRNAINDPKVEKLDNNLTKSLYAFSLFGEKAISQKDIDEIKKIEGGEKFSFIDNKFKDILKHIEGESEEAKGILDKYTKLIPGFKKGLINVKLKFSSAFGKIKQKQEERLKNLLVMSPEKVEPELDKIKRSFEEEIKKFIRKASGSKDPIINKFIIPLMGKKVAAEQRDDKLFGKIELSNKIKSTLKDEKKIKEGIETNFGNDINKASIGLANIERTARKALENNEEIPKKIKMAYNIRKRNLITQVQKMMIATSMSFVIPKSTEEKEDVEKTKKIEDTKKSPAKPEDDSEEHIVDEILEGDSEDED